MISAIHIAKRRYLEQTLAHFCAGGLPQFPAASRGAAIDHRSRRPARTRTRHRAGALPTYSPGRSGPVAGHHDPRPKVVRIAPGDLQNRPADPLPGIVEVIVECAPRPQSARGKRAGPQRATSPPDQVPMTRSPIAIDDPVDPRIAAYRDIRERDLVGREGLFIAEGEVVLRVLLGALAPPAGIAAGRGEARRGAFRTDRRAARRRARLLGEPGGDGSHRRLSHAPRDPRDRPARPDCRGADALLAGAAAGDRRRPLRHRQSRQRRRDLPQRRGVRRERRDPRQRLLRPALPQGDPRLGRRGADRSLRAPRRGEDALALLAAHGFEAMALSAGRRSAARPVERPDRVAVLFGTGGRRPSRASLPAPGRSGSRWPATSIRSTSRRPAASCSITSPSGPRRAPPDREHHLRRPRPLQISKDAVRAVSSRTVVTWPRA